jgi:PilZ domain-containing protein
VVRASVPPLGGDVMSLWELFEGGLPRAPRFALDFRVQYRTLGEKRWSSGRSTNISRSGLLFRASRPLEPDTPIELSFVMPVELTDERAGRVICRGRIVRRIAAADLPALAARIESYELIRDGNADA